MKIVLENADREQTQGGVRRAFEAAGSRCESANEDDRFQCREREESSETAG
jgi:hypothetical protein